MAGANPGLHEEPEKLSEEVRDRHRAIASLMEELEAVDWYDQRVAATTNDELREILAHNRDEEKEHAAMTLEWLRRNDAGFAEELATYLNKSGPIIGDHAGPASSQAAAEGDSSLGIGSLKAAEVSRG